MNLPAYASFWEAMLGDGDVQAVCTGGAYRRGCCLLVHGES